MWSGFTIESIRSMQQKKTALYSMKDGAVKEINLISFLLLNMLSS